jgi:Mg2+-importing ATPase
MGPLGEYFKFAPLPWRYFVWLAVIVIGYALLTSVMKRYYFRRFGWE